LCVSSSGKQASIRSEGVEIAIEEESGMEWRAEGLTAEAELKLSLVVAFLHSYSGMKPMG
jgi:hypothetical protein